MHIAHYKTKQGTTARPSETIRENEEEAHSIAHENAVDCEDCHTFSLVDEDGEEVNYSTDTGRRI